MTTYILTFYSSLSANDRYRMRDENGTAIPDADLATIFGSNGKARFILDWDGKKSSSPSKIEIRNSGNTVVMSYTAQKALLPAQLYEGTWTGGASTFTSFTPVEGKTLSENELNFLMRQIKSAQASGIKTLTTEDYNYPTTGTKTSLSFGLLAPGVYIVSEVMNNYGVDGGTYTLQPGAMIIKGNSLSSANPGVIFTNGSNGYWQQETNTTRSGKILGSNEIANNLTTTTSGKVLDARQGKVLKGLVDAKEAITLTGSAAPTTSTEGTNVGQQYYDSTNDKWYRLKTIDTSTTPATYTWEEQTGGPAVVQTAGDSTADVMSQGASHALIYADWYRTDTPNPIWAQTSNKIRIGQSFGAIATNQGAYSVLIGANGTVDGQYGVHIGSGGGTTNGESALAFQAGKADAKYSVAFDGGQVSGASQQGVFQIGLNQSYASSYGYNNSAYRLLTGLYDGQNAHDAATVGQLPAVFTNSQFNSILENA